MPRALRVCPVIGCPNLTPGGRCQQHREQAERKRGTATQRGYGHRHRTRFRRPVLLRDPLCVCPDQAHHHPTPCGAMATEADHYPRGRDELVALGLNPDDPSYGRGLCHDCHSKSTAVQQPGGWNINRLDH